MNTLIIGGTSGLGLELAHESSLRGDKVIITGRHDPEVSFAAYDEFDLSQPALPERIANYVTDLPYIDSLIYAPGFYQEGHIDELSDDDIEDMLNVGARGLLYFTKNIIRKQSELSNLVTITSTSQYVAREKESVYNFVKSGAGLFSKALSLDQRVGKVLVVAPSGMATKFWEKDGRSTVHMLPSSWVAEHIQELREDSYSYRAAKILGATAELPARVEIVETLQRS
jgi:short-subunit dehydrogenase